MAIKRMARLTLSVGGRKCTKWSHPHRSSEASHFAGESMPNEPNPLEPVETLEPPQAVVPGGPELRLHGQRRGQGAPVSGGANVFRSRDWTGIAWATQGGALRPKRSLRLPPVRDTGRCSGAANDPKMFDKSPWVLGAPRSHGALTAATLRFALSRPARRVGIHLLCPLIYCPSLSTKEAWGGFSASRHVVPLHCSRAPPAHQQAPRLSDQPLPFSFPQVRPDGGRPVTRPESSCSSPAEESRAKLPAVTGAAPMCHDGVLDVLDDAHPRGGFCGGGGGKRHQ